MKPKFIFIALLVGAIALRLYLFHYPSFHIDMTDFQAWAGRLTDIGPLHFYSPTYFSDYFPGYLYMLWIVGTVASTVFGKAIVYSGGFSMLLKLITLGFDIGTALLIYQIIRKKNLFWARVGTILYLANPTVMFNGSVWGQIDGIFTFFLIWAYYELVEKERLLWFVVAISVAVLIKPQAIMVAPIVGCYLFYKYKLIEVFKVILGIVSCIFLLALPFYLFSDPVFGLVHNLFSSTSVYPYTSLFAFNGWALVGFWQSDMLKFLGLSYQAWGYLVGGLCILLLLTLYFRDKNNHDNVRLYLLSSLSIMTFYLFFTRMHDRYLFPFFVFYLLAACLARSRFILALYGLLTIIHFFNLFYVYYYYNVIFNQPVFHHYWLYDFIDQSYKFWSFLSIMIFVVSLVYLYRKQANAKT